MNEWLARSRARLEGFDVGTRYQAVGRVEAFGDGVARISGLAGAKLGELVRFGDGAIGLTMGVTQREAQCMILQPGKMAAGSVASLTGTVAEVPVGEALLGRVINPLGIPLDGKPPPDTRMRAPVERPAPGIVDRDFVSQPLATGVTVIDAMIPLGRGQRQLIIGDRKTGKTSIAVDAMINQKGSGVVAVYVAIGQKDSSVAQVIEAIRANGDMENTIFVIGQAEAPPGLQWLAPYAGCSIAEYFRDLGRDALLVLDDLTKHAAVYRELSLLFRHPPGREAYPGDIFSIHARLLERAAKLSPEKGGGSLTALPIAETKAGNLSAYVPTNLISITDGQIYLEPKLFYEGHKPAVNVGLSVSRVGARAQPPILQQLAGDLRLAYAQFLELEVFTKFGSIVDERTRAVIEHGRRIRAGLEQPQSEPLSLAEEAALLLALSEGLLDNAPLEVVAKLRRRIARALAQHCPEVAEQINESGALSDEDKTRLKEMLDAELRSLGDETKEPVRGASEST
jgi:F-type H+-transporting ATPase subunit alpha